MTQRLAASLTGFSLVLFLALPIPDARAITLDDLSKAWIGTGETLNAATWDRMVRLMREDTDTNDLLQVIQRRLGASGPADIARIMHLCPDLEEGVAGEFQGSRSRYLASVQPDGAAPSWGAEANEARRSGIESSQSSGDVVHTLNVANRPNVCIRPGMTLLESFTTVVHELTHFRGWQALADDDVLNYRDAAEYVARTVVAPGGELEAYTAEGRARKRLKKRVAGLPTATLERFFDDDGNLTDRAGLTAYILDNLGYRQRLASEFAQKAVDQYNQAVHDRNWMSGSLRVTATKNARIMASNVEIHRRNLEILRHNGSSVARIREEEDALRASERQRDFYTDQVTGIDAEIERIDRRRQQIQERFGEFFAQAPLPEAAFAAVA